MPPALAHGDRPPETLFSASHFVLPSHSCSFPISHFPFLISHQPLLPLTLMSLRFRRTTLSNPICGSVASCPCPMVWLAANGPSGQASKNPNQGSSGRQHRAALIRGWEETGGRGLPIAKTGKQGAGPASLAFGLCMETRQGFSAQKNRKRE